MRGRKLVSHESSYKAKALAFIALAGKVQTRAGEQQARKLGE